MTTWEYYWPSGEKAASGVAPFMGLRGAPSTETIGRRQLELLLNARRSRSGQLLLTHGRQSNAARMAARRLVERGLLAGPNYLGPRDWGYLYCYHLTNRGRTCWLRSKKESS